MHEEGGAGDGEEQVNRMARQSDERTKYDTQTQRLLCKTRKGSEEKSAGAKHGMRSKVRRRQERVFSPLEPILDLECAKDVCVVRTFRMARKTGG